jgi:hypothetical protein
MSVYDMGIKSLRVLEDRVFEIIKAMWYVDGKGGEGRNSLAST